MEQENTEHKPLEKNNNTPLILWVDDDTVSLGFGMDFIKSLHHEVLGASNGIEALKIVEEHKPDLILLDVDMPEMNGYEVCRHLKSQNATKMIPILMITGLTDVKANVKGIEAGADDYITKPYDLILLKSRIDNSLKRKLYYDQTLYYQKRLEHYNNHLKDEIALQVQDIIDTQEVTIFALAKLAESRNKETGAHLERIRLICREIAILLKKHISQYQKIIDDEFIKHIYLCSPLHDIGKVGVRDSVLLKPGPLNDQEFEEIKKHPTIGGETILSAEKRLRTHNNFLQMGREIAFYHHEKWNGTGYPFGLSMEEIPLSARILACADVYDALKHKRVYKVAYSHEESCEIIREASGDQFDPEICRLFLDNNSIFKKICRQISDEEIFNAGGIA